MQTIISNQLLDINHHIIVSDLESECLQFGKSFLVKAKNWVILPPGQEPFSLLAHANIHQLTYWDVSKLLQPNMKWDADYIAIDDILETFSPYFEPTADMELAQTMSVEIQFNDSDWPTRPKQVPHHLPNESDIEITESALITEEEVVFVDLDSLLHSRQQQNQPIIHKNKAYKLPIW